MPDSTSQSLQPPRDARAWDVIGVGANSVDLVAFLPGFPEPAGFFSKMRIRRELYCCGGQTATTLAACAALGLRTKYAGATGDDENGRRIRAELVRRGVDVEAAPIRQAPNQHAIILLDERTGERTVLWDRDARLGLEAAEIPLPALRHARLLHVDDVDQEAAILAAEHARTIGLPVTSDLDRMTELTERLVAAVTYPIFAEGLAGQLTGVADHERALRKMRERHDGLLCITIGREGAVALDGDRFLHSPGFEVHALDTTGSGDVFRAGFIYALLQGWDAERTLRFANAAAAVSCTRIGAMNGVPAWNEIHELLQRGHQTLIPDS